MVHPRKGLETVLHCCGLLIACPQAAWQRCAWEHGVAWVTSLLVSQPPSWHDELHPNADTMVQLSEPGEGETQKGAMQQRST